MGTFAAKSGKAGSAGKTASTPVRGAAASGPRPPFNTKTAKFQRLIQTLEESGPGLSIRQMASALAVDERTIKRYLADLRRLGFDLQQEPDSRGRRILYRIPAVDGPPPSLLAGLRKIRSELHAGGNPKHTAHISKVIRYLEDPESALAPARRHAAAPGSGPGRQGGAPGHQGDSAGSPGGYAEASASPGAEVYHIDHGPFAEADPHPGILKILESAVADRAAIKVSYSGYAKDASPRPETEEFLFFPYILCLRVGTLYLIGRQGENRGPFKSLSVRRIRRCIATRDTFRPDPFKAEDYYKYTFGQWHRQLNEEPETVLFSLRAPWLEKYLSESRFNPPGRILRKGGEVLFELKVVVKPDFVNWVMSLAPDLLPLKPDSLRAQVADRLAKAASALQAP